MGIQVFLRKRKGRRALRPPLSKRDRPVPAPLPRHRRILPAVGRQGGLGPPMRHKATTHTPHVGPLHDLHRVARMVGFETPPVPARRPAGAVVPGPSPPGAHYTPPPGFTHQPASLPALSTPSLSAVAHAASGGRRSRHQGALCSTLPLAGRLYIPIPLEPCRRLLPEAEPCPTPLAPFAPPHRPDRTAGNALSARPRRPAPVPCLARPALHQWSAPAPRRPQAMASVVAKPRA